MNFKNKSCWLFFFCFGLALIISDYALYKIYLFSISSHSSRLSIFLCLSALMLFYILWVTYVFNMPYAKKTFCGKEKSNFLSDLKLELSDLGFIIVNVLKVFAYLGVVFALILWINKGLSFLYINTYINTFTFVFFGVVFLLVLSISVLLAFPYVWKKLKSFIDSQGSHEGLENLKKFFNENPGAWINPLTLVFGGLTFVRSTFIIFFLGSLSLRFDNGVSFCGILLFYSHISFVGCLPYVKRFLTNHYKGDALHLLGFNNESFIPKWAFRLGGRGAIGGALIFIGLEFVDTGRQLVRQHGNNLDAASETKANREWNTNNSTKPQKPDVLPKRAERPCAWDDLWGRGKK